jgi:hypothetical protein
MKMGQTGRPETSVTTYVRCVTFHNEDLSNNQVQRRILGPKREEAARGCIRGER